MDNLNWQEVDSSAVKAIAYDQLARRIYVLFHRGAVYEYENCDQEDWTELVDAESVGQHVNGQLKYKPYREVSR